MIRMRTNITFLQEIKWGKTQKLKVQYIEFSGEEINIRSAYVPKQNQRNILKKNLGIDVILQRIPIGEETNQNRET